jgi:hypothetical protein
VSPDRHGVDAYKGAERRGAHRRDEDLPPLKHGPFTTWQWAVLGAYFVAIVLSIAIYGLAHRADVSAKRGNAAICVEVGFLRSTALTAEASIRQHPDAPENAARQMSIERTRRLVKQLQTSVPSCRNALR